MENISGKCLWTCFKIWFFAVLINTFLGSMALGPLLFFSIPIMLFGAIGPAAFTFPLFIILFLVLLILVKRKFSFTICFLSLQIIGLGGAILALLAFIKWFGDGVAFSALYIIAVIAAFSSISTQIRSLKNLTDYKNPVDELFSNENDLQSSGIRNLSNKLI